MPGLHPIFGSSMSFHSGFKNGLRISIDDDFSGRHPAALPEMFFVLEQKGHLGQLRLGQVLSHILNRIARGVRNIERQLILDLQSLLVFY